MTSITNAASRENSAMKEAMAYMGIINMILITILFPVRSVSGRKESKGDWERYAPLEVWLPIILQVQVN